MAKSCRLLTEDRSPAWRPGNGEGVQVWIEVRPVVAGDLAFGQVEGEVTETDPSALNLGIGHRGVPIRDWQGDHAAVGQDRTWDTAIARVEALAGEDHPHDDRRFHEVSPFFQLVGWAWMPLPLDRTKSTKARALAASLVKTP